MRRRRRGDRRRRPAPMARRREKTSAAADGLDRSAGRLEHERDSEPFGVPTAEAAFELMRLGVGDRRWRRRGTPPRPPWRASRRSGCACPAAADEPPARVVISPSCTSWAMSPPTFAAHRARSAAMATTAIIGARSVCHGDRACRPELRGDRGDDVLGDAHRVADEPTELHRCRRPMPACA